MPNVRPTPQEMSAADPNLWLMIDEPYIIGASEYGGPDYPTSPP